MRFAWGADGARRIADDAHLVVWVDVLPSAVPGAPTDADHAARTAARTAIAAVPEGPEIVLGHLGNATTVAERVTGLQAERGDRCVVAVIAAGRDRSSVGGDAAEAAGESTDIAETPEFAVEDLLAAGAVVDALTTVGIDHTSPEAAAACAAYEGLRRAVKHLVSASEGATGLERDTVHAALAAGPELVTVRTAAESSRRA